MSGIGAAPIRFKVRYLSARCFTVRAMKRTPWKSSPYLRCGFSAALTHLLESLTFAG
ncbi:hypothetical protein B0G74_8476 [Paraburkholderia sp. BL9I2N2]|nr:hypothetical protein B0G74_8476 [Paraburkholderia sp. BL9I2N2]